MNIHNLQLATEPFEAIVDGRKVIESRLYDDKRRLIELGDTIVFINREDASRMIKARVIGLLRYGSFHDLFTHNEATKFGRVSAEALEKQINVFYSSDDQQKYGVLGIEFQLSN